MQLFAEIKRDIYISNWNLSKTRKTYARVIKIISGAFYVDVKHIKKKEPPRRRDYKISMYGRVVKTKPQGKGGGSSGKTTGTASQSKSKSPKKADSAEGSTVVAAGFEEGAVGGAASSAQTDTSILASQNASLKFKKPDCGNSEVKSKLSQVSTKTPSAKTSQKASTKSTNYTSKIIKFQSLSSNSGKDNVRRQNMQSRKSHAVSHKDEPRQKKAKTSSQEDEPAASSSRLPVASASHFRNKTKKSLMSQREEKKQSNSEKAEENSISREETVKCSLELPTPEPARLLTDDLYPIPDVEINGKPEDSATNDTRRLSAGLKQLDLRKKIMLHKTDSDQKLVDEDSVSICSHMAVRGSVCNSNEDLSPSDFGSDYLSEASSQHDVDGHRFSSQSSQNLQAQSRDDGYSSNRTPPEDYSPEMEEILAAVDAVHFEPEPLISTFDVVFEPANQEQ